MAKLFLAEFLIEKALSANFYVKQAFSWVTPAETHVLEIQY